VVTDVVTWVCRSPRRLAVTIGSVILLIVIGGAVMNGGGGSGGSDDAGRTPPAAASPSAAAVPDASPFVSAAVTFADAWATREDGETKDEWLDRVSALSTPELSEALATTDLEQLPGAAPSGRPTVRYVAEQSALVAVPLDNGDTILVTVVSAGRSRWLASDVQPDVGDFGDVP
jgi:hypothetical protein